MSFFQEEVEAAKAQRQKEYNDMIANSEEWVPSNGNEGRWFEEKVCEGCKKYVDEACPLIDEAMWQGRQPLWLRVKGKTYPVCMSRSPK